MQGEGCCGVLKALQANPGTGVEILDLPVSVTPERRGRGGKKLHVQYVNDKVLPEGFYLWHCCRPVRTRSGPQLGNMDTLVCA